MEFAALLKKPDDESFKNEISVAYNNVHEFFKLVSDRLLAVECKLLGYNQKKMVGEYKTELLVVKKRFEMFSINKSTQKLTHDLGSTIVLAVEIKAIFNCCKDLLAKINAAIDVALEFAMEINGQLQEELAEAQVQAKVQPVVVKPTKKRKKYRVGAVYNTPPRLLERGENPNKDSFKRWIDEGVASSKERKFLAAVRSFSLAPKLLAATIKIFVKSEAFKTHLRADADVSCLNGEEGLLELAVHSLECREGLPSLDDALFGGKKQKDRYIAYENENAIFNSSAKRKRKRNSNNANP